MRGMRTGGCCGGCCCGCCGCDSCCGGRVGGGADCSLTKTSYLLPSEPSMDRSARSVDASLSRAVWVAGGSAEGGLGAACAAAAAPSTAAVGGRFLCLTPARHPRRVRLRPCCCCCSAPGAGRAAPAAGRSGGRGRLRLGAATAVTLALAAKAAWARKRAAGLGCCCGGGGCCWGGGGCCWGGGGCCWGGGGCCWGGGGGGRAARVTSSKSPSRSRAFELLSRTAEPSRDTAAEGKLVRSTSPEFCKVCRTVSPCSRHHVVESGAAAAALRKHT